MAMSDFIEKAKAWFDANERKAEAGIAFVIGLILGGFLF
jgi:hypothetical protein